MRATTLLVRAVGGALSQIIELLTPSLNKTNNTIATSVLDGGNTSEVVQDSSEQPNGWHTLDTECKSVLSIGV